MTGEWLLVSSALLAGLGLGIAATMWWATAELRRYQRMREADEQLIHSLSQTIFNRRKAQS